MKELRYAADPLNEQASLLVDAQTDIKTAVKQGVLSAESAERIKKRLSDIIERAVARIRSPTLKKDARASLMQFANKVYGEFTQALSAIPYAMLPAVIVLMRGATEKEVKGKYYTPTTPSELNAAEVLHYRVINGGVPLREFQKVYIDRVNNALQTLSETKALDPNDYTGRNSLRNLAEMQVRYERHQEEIKDFKDRKVKLVVCSVHADCSDRCSKWQGGVYSLDGTSGYTTDGRPYQPLENATDIYYTTKAGRTYKNGLLGFNCRHKLYEYKERMGIPTVSRAEQKRQYQITLKQRELERSVIAARENALTYKDTGCIVYKRNGKPLIDKATGKPVTQYHKWKTIAQKRYAEYKKFSEEHERAYYPDRVKIL